jgi:hypothetical protein
MTLVEAYEEEHSIPDASPAEVLGTLMDANDLRQQDLVPIFGSERIVSELLHKKRDLNKGHIEKLSKRFHVGSASDTWTCPQDVFWPNLLLRDTAFSDSDIYVATYNTRNHMTIDQVVEIRL